MTITPFLNRFVDVILNPVIALLFSIAVAYFIYNVVNFLRLEPGDKARDEARKGILWGIVGFVIMISVYGIIQFILSVVGVSSNDPSLINAKPYIAP